MTIAIMLTLLFCSGMAALFFAALTGEQDYRAKAQLREKAAARDRFHRNNVHFLAPKSQ